MSVETIMHDETTIKAVEINNELPDVSELVYIKNIQQLTIRNITDSKKLYQFLLQFPLSAIRRLEFISCNMESVDVSIFEKLQLVETIELQQCDGIDYNEVLRRIPNKGQVKKIGFWTDTQESRNINPQLLEEFIGLETLGLRNFLGMNMEALHSYLLTAKKLAQLSIDGNIKSLDFITGIDFQHIDLMDENLDLRLITPDIAKSHQCLTFSTDKGTILIQAIMDGQGYELNVPLKYMTKLDSIRELIDNAESVKGHGGAIQVDNEDEFNQILKNGDIIESVSEISIQVPHIGVIKPTELEQLRQYTKLSKIVVMDSEYSEYLEEFQYTPEQYEILYSKVQEIVGDIPEEFTELQKLMIIYKRLASTISYDYELVRKDEERDIDYIEDNRITGRNLTNGLIKGKCVCAGYSDILYNCLQSVGINACKISGEVPREEGESRRHAWNKVQIDEVWYNVDLTWDHDTIVQDNGRELKYCLRSDTEFQEEHTPEKGKKVECTTDYPRKEIEKAYEFAVAFEKGEVALDAEYEVIEGPGFFARLKNKIREIFNRRKMIEAPKETPKLPTMEERRDAWLRKGGIVLENGAEISRIDRQEEITKKTTIKDREIDD